MRLPIVRSGFRIEHDRIDQLYDQEILVTGFSRGFGLACAVSD
jgi:hypothetical protein